MFEPSDEGSSVNGFWGLPHSIFAQLKNLAILFLESKQVKHCINYLLMPKLLLTASSKFQKAEGFDVLFTQKIYKRGKGLWTFFAWSKKSVEHELQETVANRHGKYFCPFLLGRLIYKLNTFFEDYFMSIVLYKIMSILLKFYKVFSRLSHGILKS